MASYFSTRTYPMLKKILLSVIKFFKHPFFGLVLSGTAAIALGMSATFFGNFATDQCTATSSSPGKSLAALSLTLVFGGFMTLIFMGLGIDISAVTPSLGAVRVPVPS